MTMTTRQAVQVWEDLLDAYHMRNSFGGDTAEVYGYLLVENNPSANQAGEGSMRDKARATQAGEAAENLTALLRLFLETHGEASIAVDGSPFRGSMLAPIYHRVHVRVTTVPVRKVKTK